MTTLTIPLKKEEKERLSRLALQYGLRLSDFSRHVLTKLSSDIPEESIDEYKSPRRIRTDLRRAMKDYRAGRYRTRL